MSKDSNDQKIEAIERPRFIHLRVHSAYSLLEGALKVKEVIKYALHDHAPAIAITDTNNLFGALEFTQYCFADGIQPIIGCQLAIDFEDVGYDPRITKWRYPSDFTSIVLLAATETGYKNLVHLVSRAYLDKSETDPANAKIDWVEELGEGIIALTGGPNGPINTALVDDKKERAIARLERLQKAFGNRLYMELQRHGNYDRMNEAAIVELAYKHGIPLVATNEAFFKDKSSYEAHDALLAIAEGQIVSNPDRRRVTPDHYLKTQKEMVELFSDIPEAVENTV